MRALILIALLLAGCESDRRLKAARAKGQPLTLVADLPGIDVYRFKDGDVTCYVHYNGISCVALAR